MNLKNFSKRNTNSTLQGVIGKLYCGTGVKTFLRPSMWWQTFLGRHKENHQQSPRGNHGACHEKWQSLHVGKWHHQSWDRTVWLYNESCPWESQRQYFKHLRGQLWSDIATKPSLKGNLEGPAVVCLYLVAGSLYNSGFVLPFLYRNYSSEQIGARWTWWNQIPRVLYFLFDMHLDLWPKVPWDLLDRPRSFLNLKFTHDQL